MWIAEGVIEYYGWVTDVKHFLSKAQVYVLPSYGEGLPRSVLEAMSMGRPIITTLTSGCKETVVHEHNGLLIEPKSVRGLVAAMEYFILNQNFVSTMGSNSRKIAEEKYDVDSVNQILIESMGLK